MKVPFKNAFAIAVAVCLVMNVPAYAHNEHVHSGMVDLSYQIMKAVEIYGAPLPPNLAPQDVPIWKEYVDAIKNAPNRYRKHPGGLPDPVADGAPYPCNLAPSWWVGNMGDIQHPIDPKYARVLGNKMYGSFTGCGVWDEYTPGGIFTTLNNPPRDETPLDYTGTVLGFWAANVDAGFDDTHLWIRPSSAGGAGAVKNFVNKGTNYGIAILLAPFICLAELIAGNPDACWGHAMDAADALNPLDEIEGLIPGIGDISGDSTTGMWHHIQILGGGDNEFDDHQGLLLASAGPFSTMDQVDIALVAAMDVGGLSINYDASDGVKRYESKGGDGLPATVSRSHGEWQFTTVPHTAFEPVDNLGQYGLNAYYNDKDHPTRFLGYPLHALGDATVPMHVAGTPSWGHRPFEDASEDIWADLRLENETNAKQVTMINDILFKGFAYYKMIRAWRISENKPLLVPVRHVITALATNTANYSMSVQASKGWPFNEHGSFFYQFLGDDGQKISKAWYAFFPNAVDLYYPILTDGAGAMVAFLTTASEVLQ